MIITWVEISVGIVIFICILTMITVLSGNVEKALNFGEWWKSDSAKWGFRFSIVGLSISIIALTLALYFTWSSNINSKNIDTKLDLLLLKIDK